MIDASPEAFDYPPFPSGLFPDPVRSFIRRTSDAIGCDPTFVAMPTIAALGAAVGNSRRIRLKDTWTEFPIFWCVCINDSGTGKTPAFNAALQPLYDLQHIELDRHANMMDLHDQEIEQHEIDLKKWKESTRDPEQRPVLPEQPIAVRYVVNDITVEKLAEVLSNNPRGVVAATDELYSWFRSFDQYRNGRGGDVGKWLTMWSGGSLFIDRKSHDTITVKNASASLCGTIQPSVFTDALGQQFIDNGLAARLLLAMPPRRSMRWNENTMPKGLMERMTQLYASLVAMRFNSVEGKLEPVDVCMSPDARKLWVILHNRWASIHEGITDANDMAVSAKLSGYAARFALLFHMIQVAAGDRSSIDEEAIDEQSVATAWQIVDWFANENRRIYGILHEPDEQRHMRRLVEAIEAAGGTMSLRTLQRVTRNGSAKVMRDDLRAMQDLGIGRLISIPPTEKGGRPSDSFQLKEGFCHNAVTKPHDKTPTDEPEKGADVTKPPTRDREGVLYSVTALKNMESDTGGGVSQLVGIQD